MEVFVSVLHKHHCSAGMGWCRPCFWFHLCAQASPPWPCSLCRLPSVCASPWFHPAACPPPPTPLLLRLCLLTSPSITLCFCALRKTQHAEVNLCATATWKQVSNLVCTCQQFFKLPLWWLLNYALIFVGVRRRSPFCVLTLTFLRRKR